MFSPFLSENLAGFHIKVKKGRLRSARPMTMLSGGPLLIRTPYQAGVEYDRISFLNAGQSAQTECTKTVSHLFYERAAHIPKKQLILTYENIVGESLSLILWM